MFKPASKEKSKLRMAITGPSGSGKTFTALTLAQHLGSNVALIDTERGSASKYAGRFKFDVAQLTSFHPNKYIEAITAAGRMGFDVLIVDSLTHAWFWELDASANSSSGNSFTAWAKLRPIERALIDALLSSPAHVIVTMRTKTEWVIEQTTNKRGDSVSQPRRVGTAPVQASGIEYEFDLAGELDLAHILTISKSRCPELADSQLHCPGQELATCLLGWLEDGVEPTPVAFNPPTALAPAEREQMMEQIAAELQRLGWTADQGQRYLKQQYAKTSRKQLNDAELIDFLEQLAEMVVETPASTTPA